MMFRKVKLMKFAGPMPEERNEDTIMAWKRESKDYKDRIFHKGSLKYGLKVPVAENESPNHIHYLGEANTFKVEEGFLICDVFIYDKFEEKIINKDKSTTTIIKNIVGARPYLGMKLDLVKHERDAAKYLHIEKAVLKSLFFSNAKVLKEQKGVVIKNA